MRKFIAIVIAAVTAVTIGLSGAGAADAYLHTEDGYTYADTSYKGNISGSYFKTISRYDARSGTLYVNLTGTDQTCDNRYAAARVRGYNKETRSWRYDVMLWVGDPCKGQGQTTISIPVRAHGIDSVNVSDGIKDVTYGKRYMRIYSR